MRRPPLFALLALAALLASAAPAFAISPTTVRDGRIVDAQGRTVVLHGFNLVYKVPPYRPNPSQGERTSFDADDARRLRRWGFNALRLGYTWAAVEPRRGHIDHEYLRDMARIVRLAGRHGLYVLIDMHQDEYAERFKGNGAPDWAVEDDGIPFGPSLGHPFDYTQPAVGRSFTNFWENKNGIRSRFVAAYVAIARSVRDEPAVVGYDAFNEPSCELGRPPCGLPPQPEAAGRWLHPFYDELVPALERVDRRHPVFYEDWLTTDFGYPFSVGVPPNPRWPFRDTGLSYHVYCAAPYLRAEVPCPDAEQEAINDAAGNARLNGAVPLLTEFGATDDLAILARIADFADAAGHGWQYWQYKTYFDPTTSARRPGGDPSEADAESLIDERGKLKRDKLEVLARPFPARIAGRAARWEWEGDRRRFEMTWRPARRGTTVVSVPTSVHFPDGYRVEAEGARVVSRPGSRLLRLRGAERLRGKASVTILPR